MLARLGTILAMEESEESPRLGVLGGTFDPPHAGHLALAEEAMVHFGLHGVLFVVAGDPWQKRDDVDAGPDDRLAMTEALVEGHQGFEVSAIEVEREGPSYTADTLEALAEDRPDRELYLVLGADAAAGLDTWERPERVRDLATVVVAPRPEEVPGLEGVVAALRSQGWRCEILPMDEHAVSSTEVRARLRGGDPVEALVPGPVVRVIEERGLYTRSG